MLTYRLIYFFDHLKIDQHLKYFDDILKDINNVDQNVDQKVDQKID